MKLTGSQIVGLGVVAFGVYAVYKATKTASAVVDAVNPASGDNIINRGFNEVIGATDRGSSLGSDIFDLVQRLRGIKPYDPNALPVGYADDMRAIKGQF